MGRLNSWLKRRKSLLRREDKSIRQRRSIYDICPQNWKVRKVRRRSMSQGIVPDLNALCRQNAINYIAPTSSRCQSTSATLFKQIVSCEPKANETNNIIDLDSYIATDASREPAVSSIILNDAEVIDCTGVHDKNDCFVIDRNGGFSGMKKNQKIHRQIFQKNRRILARFENRLLAFAKMRKRKRASIISRIFKSDGCKDSKNACVLAEVITVEDSKKPVKEVNVITIEDTDEESTIQSEAVVGPSGATTIANEASVPEIVLLDEPSDDVKECNKYSDKLSSKEMSSAFHSLCCRTFSKIRNVVESYKYKLQFPNPHEVVNTQPDFDYEKDSSSRQFCDLLTKGTASSFGRILRHWEEIQRMPSNCSSLRICSYNVLCQNTIGKTKYLYRHLFNIKDNEQYISWESRSRLLAEEFPMINADVFCLQEVQEDHYKEFFTPLFMKAGYEGVYKKRTGQMADGCAIFYKSHLQLLNYKPIEFFVSSSSLLNRDNIAQIVRLKDSKSGQQFCVGNTHLLFNKRRGDVKLAQLAILLAHLDKECGPDSNMRCPFVLCGDFNIQPHCPIYSFIMDRKLVFNGLKQFELSGQGESGGRYLREDLLPPEVNVGRDCRFNNFNGCTKDSLLDHWTHSLDFASVYTHLDTSFHPEISTFNAAEASNPDFIFYSIEAKRVEFNAEGANTVHVCEGEMKLIRRLSLPNEPALRSTHGACPNAYTPSDHIPLIVDFALW